MNSIAHGGRSMDEGGYCPGGLLVQKGGNNWLSRDVQETNQRNMWKGK